ncbi:hypothetical protein AVEN_132340-1 [Araneus ventricosus]|uniref:Nucleic-acid-binding protein from transposon X-element n=1 Tax=Araneus ventricosus TaxID=182803 RepID=A0A4Y2MQC9_ARAVE|nr:hypothetical protein AVEN_132340-1 [Araneus ventricosus]
MPRKKLSCSSNYNKNRNEINVYCTRSSNKVASPPQRPDPPSFQSQQDPRETHEWSNVGRGYQGLPQQCLRSSTPLKETKSNTMVVASPQTFQQKLSRSPFLEGKFQSTSMEALNALPLAEFTVSTPISTSSRAPLTPLDLELQNAIQEKINFVQKVRSVSYSRMRERDPQRFSNLVEDLGHFAGGILMSDIVDNCEELASYVKSLSSNTSNSQSSTPASAIQTPQTHLNPQGSTRKPFPPLDMNITNSISKASEEENSTIQPKDEISPLSRTLPSPNKSRTTSPILDANSTTLNSFSSTPINTSFPHQESTLPLLSPDTSDIEGALKDMGPLKMQDFEEEEDLEILYSRLKGNSKCNSQDLLSEEEDPDSFHALAERIRVALSVSNPDINKALSLLDTLQANYLAAEISKVTPVPVKQSSQQITKNLYNMNQLSTTSDHQAATGNHIFPPPNQSNSIPPEPAPNPTILLYPTTDSTSNLSEILNEALSPRDYNPTNIKPLRGNGLAISFQTSSQIKQFQSKLKENSNLKSAITIKLPTKRSPSFILYNVPNPTKEEDIQEALKSQLNLKNPLNLRFKFKGNTTSTTNWVFEATSQTLNIIQQIQKIQIGWSMLKISEFFHFKKCNFCQAFGHTTKDCHRQIPSCSRCADHHLITDCQSQSYCCINCLESNIFTGSELPTFHSAKDRSCPFFQDAINKYRATRDYS